MIVVIGGQARNVGKTTAMCAIISATVGLAWTAVKLTSHPHAPAHTGAADTDRYLRAGARRALLLHSAAEVPAEGNVIVESNSILEHLTPDLFLFVTDACNAEWKASAHKAVLRADATIEGALSAGTLRTIVDRLLSRTTAPE